MRTLVRTIILFSIWLGFAAAPVAAQSIESLYRGKTVKLVLAAAPGGGADLYARIFIKHFGRHVPGNPTFVIQNVPGAGGMTAALQMMNAAPRDGSTIAFLQRNSLVEPILAEQAGAFDPRKLNWLGSLNKDTYVIIAWHASGVATLDDVRQKELVLGNTGGGNENLTFPELLNQTAGTKFRLVRGYPGSHDLALAIERGEVQGRALTWTTLRGDHPDWIRDHKVNILVQLGLSRNPEIGDAPSALELVTKPEDRQLLEFMFAPLEAGRPFALPPDTPEPIVTALRKAFVELAADREFVDEVKARGGSIEFIDGDAAQALIRKLYETPPQVVERARSVLRASRK